MNNASRNCIGVSRILGPKSLGLAALSLLISWLVLPASDAHADDEMILQFGIYTAVKPSAMIRKFLPLTKELEAAMTKSLKRPVAIRFKVAYDYDTGIDHIATGKVDFARFGPASYIQASKKNPHLSLLAVESKDGKKTIDGIIAVRQDSPIKAISDLKGKSFAFGNELSTIGRYLSQQHLLQHGVRAKDLKKYIYLGRHDAVGAAVGAGRFDAGALKEKTFNRLRSSGTPLRELARFPNAPQAWIGRQGLEPAVEEALRAALLGIRNQKALSPLNADQLVKGTPEDYALVRSAMDMNEDFFR